MITFSSSSFKIRLNARISQLLKATTWANEQVIGVHHDCRCKLEGEKTLAVGDFLFLLVLVIRLHNPCAILVGLRLLLPTCSAL